MTLKPRPKPDPRIPTVPLDMVFAWTCPCCQKRRYEEPPEVKLTAQERSEMAQEYGDAADWTGSWVTSPSTVICPDTLQLFNTPDEN